MTRRALAAAATIAAAALLAGCGGSTRNVVSGGEVPGTTRTVYSLLPHPGHGASRDMVLGEKLAIQEAGGIAGGYGLSFVSLDDSASDPARVAARAATQTERAIHDAQVVAVIGGTGSEAARVEIPLIDAAGILHLLPGAGYPGFTRRWANDDEPERWQPGGGNDIVRLVPDDVVQGRALVAAAVKAAGRRHRAVRIAVEQEPGFAADALRRSIDVAAGGAHLVGDASRADVVIYAGEDPVNAAGVVGQITGTGTPVVLPDALVMAGVADQLGPAARRRAVLVSSAPAPGAPELRRIAPRFRAAFGTDPGPYAVLGYEAMNAIVSALEHVGGRDLRRQAVTAAFDPPAQRGFTAYYADGRPLR